jgi:hypothetical protein
MKEKTISKYKIPQFNRNGKVIGRKGKTYLWKLKCSLRGTIFGLVFIMTEIKMIYIFACFQW